MRSRNTDAPVTLYAAESPAAGSLLSLGSDVAAHIRALRAEPGAAFSITNGCGLRAAATLRRVAKGVAQFEVGPVAQIERGSAIHLLVAVADKDRMLWLAEKAVEFGVASWRPVLWRRSRSVNSRGEGAGFRKRLHARMVAALIQSGGAWLPDIFPETNVERAIAASPSGSRVLLSQHATSPFPQAAIEPIVVAIGPEGGIEADELAAFQAAQFSLARVAANTLRFETAGIAAMTLAWAAIGRMTGGENG